MSEVVQFPKSQQLLEIQSATNAVSEFLRTMTVPQRCEILAALLTSAVLEAGKRPDAKDSALAITRVQCRMVEAFRQLFPHEVPFV